METVLLDKESFTVIGKLGQGYAKDSGEWIPPLWKEANEHFGEIEPLIKKDAQGRPSGIWGAMSDMQERFERWGDEGKYMAACEVADGGAAPQGWTRWVIPSYRYVTVKCTQQNYGEVFGYMVNTLIPEKGYSIVAAVQEYYSPEMAPGELYLYFPIEKL